MKINAYAQNAIRSASLANRSDAADGSRSASNTRAASSAVQVRLSESGKQLAKASTAREDLGKVDAGLEKLQKAIAAARDGNATADSKAAAQKDFVKARTDVESAAATQAKNLKDAPTEVRRAGAVSTDELGAKASSSIRSVKALKDLDLTTASADQLTQAAKVVESARSQLSERSQVADKAVEGLTRKVTILENTQAVIGGETTKAQQRQVDALQVLQNLAKAQNPLTSGINVFA